MAEIGFRIDATQGTEGKRKFMRTGLGLIENPLHPVAIIFLLKSVNMYHCCDMPHKKSPF